MKKIPLLALIFLPFAGIAQLVPTLVSDVNAGSDGSNPVAITALGNEIVFQAMNGSSNGLNLFRYKPGVGVAQISGTGAYSAIYDTYAPLWSFGVINNRLFFLTRYAPVLPSPTPGNGSTYSLAEGGIPQVVDTGVASLVTVFNPDLQTALLGGKLYCWGTTTAGGFGLCYVNATNHLVLAAPFNPSFEYSFSSELTACNNKIFFTASISGSTILYVFDPATNVFTAIDIPGSIGMDAAPRDLYGGDNNTLYFSAISSTDGRELYSYSAAGTVTKLTSLNTSADGVYKNPGDNFRSYNLIKFGNAIYFSGCNGLNGFDLMKYDLSTSTSSLIKDIALSTASSKPHSFYIYSGKLYFVADNGSSGNELWVTDGTAANTTMVSDINPGITGSSPNSFCTMGSKMYFAADNGTAGREIFSYSGTGTPGAVASLEYGNNVVAYPNPAAGAFTVSIDLAEAAGLSIQLSDINGKQVYRQEEQQYAIGTNKIVIPLQNFPAGVYFYSVFNAGLNRVASGKINHK